MEGGPHVSPYCCILRLCATGTSGVHISINNSTSINSTTTTTTGVFGASCAPRVYGAPRVPQAMRAAVTSYYEAGASPKIVQNLLRLRYKHDHLNFMQIPGHAVLRNFLRNLRKQNDVLAHEVPMTGSGERPPPRNLPNADVSGVPLDSLDEPVLELGANMVVAELQALCEAKDFKVWLSARDTSVPPLGIPAGGEQGQHAALGHGLITFAQFCSARCVTAFNERIFLSTVVECVKACHDPLYHEKNPEYGSWEHRQYGLALSSDDTYKIGYGGDISWEMTALCVVVVNLSNDTSRRGCKAHGVTNRSLPLMFQYQKRSTTDSLLQMVAALQFAVHELAHLPADHPSGLGHLLKPEWDTIHIATGCGDHAPQVANQFNARQDSQEACIISATRPQSEEYQTVFMTCYTHLAFKLEEQKYEGGSAEQKDIARKFIKKATKSIYYSSTGEERDWLWDLVFMASALTHNTAIGAWFQEQYQQPPWSCWQYTASGLPGAVPNNNPHESFWKDYKNYCLDGVRVGHKAFLHEVFPRSLFQMWPDRMGAPVRQIRYLSAAQLLEAEDRLKHEDAVVQSAYQDREFFVRPGVFAGRPLPVCRAESCLPSVAQSNPVCA